MLFRSWAGARRHVQRGEPDGELPALPRGSGDDGCCTLRAHMSEYQKAERMPDVSLTPLYAGHGGAGPERALCLTAYLEDHP